MQEACGGGWLGAGQIQHWGLTRREVSGKEPQRGPGDREQDRFGPTGSVASGAERTDQGGDRSGDRGSRDGGHCPTKARAAEGGWWFVAMGTLDRGQALALSLAPLVAVVQSLRDGEQALIFAPLSRGDSIWAM
ncbi:hypothetical protein MATL_G00067300 [Megalops atlanticus]|uniref:Uncharacterized protein n=1 Tax=Megalops atlanticus TaxID=7932 RepID=A0A9D3QDN1_MEGAT|nr:hypothetical protein MATL_G00067300 [Megalops atlanticus]